MRKHELIQVGDTFERWTVVGAARFVDGAWAVPCRCACGEKRPVGVQNLYGGTSGSCGCLMADLRRAVSTARRELPPSCEEALAVWCVRRGVSVDQIRGAGRAPSVVRLRQEAFAHLRDLGFSLPEIGRATRRDHTTVLYGLRVHARRVGDVKKEAA
jgi:hypothetical protein